jgi:hypothetical protein
MPTPTSSDILLGLYRGYFLRAPDAEGYADWLNQLASEESTLEDVSEGFFSHPYAQNNLQYGSLSDEAFVRAIYANILNGTGDEEPTQDEIDYWVDFLDGSSRADMVLQFVTDSLTEDFTDETAWPDEAVREAGQRRQDVILNSNDVARTFMATLGEATDVSDLAKLDPSILANDPAFLASQKIISGVTHDPATSGNAKTFITDVAAASPTPIATINGATYDEIFGGDPRSNRACGFPAHGLPGGLQVVACAFPG